MPRPTRSWHAACAPWLQGTLFKVVDVRFTPDFGDGRTVIQDAYMDLRVKPLLRVRGGKFKVPFGLERLVSASDLLLHGARRTGRVSPRTGTWASCSGARTPARCSPMASASSTGSSDGGSTDIDDHDARTWRAACSSSPLPERPIATGCQGLGFGIAASYGEVTGSIASPNLATYRTTGNQTYYRYRTDAVADGTRVRLSPQAYYYSGRLGVLSEYTVSRQEVRRGTIRPGRGAGECVRCRGVLGVDWRAGQLPRRDPAQETSTRQPARGAPSRWPPATTRTGSVTKHSRCSPTPASRPARHGPGPRV